MAGKPLLGAVVRGCGRKLGLIHIRVHREGTVLTNVQAILRFFVSVLLLAACAAATAQAPLNDKNIYSLANEIVGRISAAQSVEDVHSLVSQFDGAFRARIAATPKSVYDIERDAFMEKVGDGALALGDWVLKENLPETVLTALKIFSLGLPTEVLGQLLQTQHTATPRAELLALSRLVQDAAKRRLEELLKRDGLLEQYQAMLARTPSVSELLRKAQADFEKSKTERTSPSLRPTSPQAADCTALKNPSRSEALLKASEASWLKLTARCTGRTP